HVAGTALAALSHTADPGMGLQHRRRRPRLLPLSPPAGQLSARQRGSLERGGYLLVPFLLGGKVIAPMANRLSELVRQTVASWDADPSPDITEPGVVHAKLKLADPGFATCCDHPLLAQAATTVLGPDWHLAALSLRAPLPGCGHQGLHPDFEQRRTEGRWQTLAAMWCITAFRPDNGPLRVITGAHRGIEPPDTMLP